jgi:hypothetical protein
MKEINERLAMKILRLVPNFLHPTTTKGLGYWELNLMVDFTQVPTHFGFRMCAPPKKKFNSMGYALF